MTGGMDATGNPLSEAAIITLGNNLTYKVLDDLPIPLANHVSTLLHGEIAVCGGETTNQVVSDQCFFYNRC